MSEVYHHRHSTATGVRVLGRQRFGNRFRETATGQRSGRVHQHRGVWRMSLFAKTLSDYAERWDPRLAPATRSMRKRATFPNTLQSLDTAQRKDRPWTLPVLAAQCVCHA